MGAHPDRRGQHTVIASGGNCAEAARFLKIGRSTPYRWVNGAKRFTQTSHHARRSRVLPTRLLNVLR